MEITHFSVQEEDNIEHINAKSHVFIIWQSNHENRFPYIYIYVYDRARALEFGVLCYMSQCQM